MIVNKYPKPPLELRYWCVTRKDLYMLYRFIWEQFPEHRVNIFLETKAGNNKVYLTFEEMAEDIEVVLSMNDEVQKIVVWQGEIAPHNPLNRRIIWLSIDFMFNSARLSLFASDTNGELAEWADNSYKEMQRMFNLFRPSAHFIELLRRDFNRIHPERRQNKDGVVAFDYDGNIKDRIFRELASPDKHSAEERAPSGRWWHDRSMVAGLIGAVLLFVLLLASLF